MRLIAARVQKYRSIRDTGWFDVENGKTILVGANEAGKTAILQALQKINPPEGVAGYDALRDYPRSEYNDITVGKVKPSEVTVATARFKLDDSDLGELPVGFDGDDATYIVGCRLDNTYWHDIDGGPKVPVYDDAFRKDLARLAAHVDKRQAEDAERPSVALASVTERWIQGRALTTDRADQLAHWLDAVTPLVDEANSTEENRLDRLVKICRAPGTREAALQTLFEARPVFVLFSNYFRVRPLIHLDHLATRLENGILDDDEYDYGNTCLMKLLGFTARELSDLGKAAEPPPDDVGALQGYRDQLDKRSYQLNAASVRLTNEIRRVWNPDPTKPEADKLRVSADAQYLKVAVEDDLGVEVELNQRSEGFQWLVSFFVVFFAEAVDKHKNAILLLDEPGLSLHGLKQREFRETISRLAASNQTLYTTHSPFLVGPDELDLVRVVEMTDRTTGTSVHTSVTASDPASLLPLQEALGYDLAQSLFSQKRNLVLEGLTDLWYVEATAQLLRDADGPLLNDKIALLPADGAGKVAYYATILHANSLKVAALLDSDAAGDAAAQQDILVHRLGNKNVLRTKDVYSGPVSRPEIEDLLRETLVSVANDQLGWDVSATVSTQKKRPIVDIFTDEIKEFSKYRLAKAYVRWTREHSATGLTATEREDCGLLVEAVNKVLK